MAGLKELMVKADDTGGWQSVGTTGMTIKYLWEDKKSGASIALMKVARGKGVPQSHVHASNQFMYCLKGRYSYTASNIVLTPGTFYMNPKDHPHGPTVAEEESLLIEIYDGPHYYQAQTPDYARHPR